MRAPYRCVSHFKRIPFFPPLHRTSGMTLAYSPLASFYTTILHPLTTVGAEISFTSPPLYVLSLPPLYLFQLPHSVFISGRESALKQMWNKEILQIRQKKKKKLCKRINILAVKLLSVSAIKKCFCIIGDFLDPSERGGKTFEVNSELLHLAVRTN